MDLQESVLTRCPCCGDEMELLIDRSAGTQEYVEDCATCCRPLVVSVTFAGDGEVALDVRPEDA